ncbi:MAG: 4-hydroxyphenylacetate 3-hydroxylase N-terminal domain-containing protein, partial [Chloroflexota bacterium]|nr:4-hydroxyphenylacetate 3-hydroxylase N-terminal domain-containing protein [Chloroflexota bacterium]
MPARSGQQYIDKLSENPAEVWIGGEKVEDVTIHPAFQNGVHSLATLYDLQHNPNTKDTMTFESPKSGDPVGLSFIVPKTVDDLVKRRDMMTAWAWESCGMMARTPDF